MSPRDLISKLFASRGIKSVDELSIEEKETFAQYERVLSKEELTLEDVKNFLRSNISIIEARWRDNSMTAQAKGELIPYHTCYKALLTAIEAPMLERSQLENYLLGMITTK